MYALCSLYKTEWSELCVSVDGVFTTELLAKSNASPTDLQVILPVEIDKLFNFREFTKKRKTSWFEEIIRSLVKKKILLQPKLKIDHEIKLLSSKEGEFNYCNFRDTAYWHYVLGCPENFWRHPDTHRFTNVIKSGEYLTNKDYQNWHKKLY